MPDLTKAPTEGEPSPSTPLLAGGHASGQPDISTELSTAMSLAVVQEEASVVSNADDFDTKQSGLHQISQVLHDSQGKSEWIDEFAALLMVLSAYAGLLYVALRWSWRMVMGLYHEDAPSAVALAKLSGDVILAVAVFAIVLLWTTICYKSTPVHGFWQGKYTKLFTNTLMPGGFAPRPTALSLGTLMFVTSTLIKEDLKKGTDLDQHTIEGYEACRAVEMESIHADQMWLSRLHRHGPANLQYTCFNVNQSDALGYVFSAGAFTWPDYENISLLVHPKFQNNTLRDETAGFFGRVQNGVSTWFLENFVNQSKFDDPSQWECKYQCIKWQSVGIKSLLSSVSILLVGCATITKFTDLISRNFSFRGIKGHFKGGQFVSEDTSSKEMFEILRKTLKMDCIPKSRAGCFLILIFSLIVPMQMISPKICLDGYYSVDYWVSGVFISSLIIALILRRWNPYLNAPMVYTKALWEDGEDMFVKIDPPHDTEYKKIDLYQWFHLSNVQRNGHLFKYARQVSADDVDSEIKRQNKTRNKCLTISGGGVEIDGVYGWEKPPEKKKTFRDHTIGRLADEPMGIYKHAKFEGNFNEGNISKHAVFEYSDIKHAWVLSVAEGGTIVKYISTKTEHGNIPPTYHKAVWKNGFEEKKEQGLWTSEDKTKTVYLKLKVKPAAACSADMNKKRDMDSKAGPKVDTNEIGIDGNTGPQKRDNDGKAIDGKAKVIVPKHFRWKASENADGTPAEKAEVQYDPALDDDNKPLFVMSLNTFETVEWIEGVASDTGPDADLPNEVSDDVQDRFVVRKVRTMIRKGTVGVVVAKKSKVEAVILWSVGERRFFPPLHRTSPDTPVMHRIKATCNLPNLMEVSEEWKNVRKKLDDLRAQYGMEKRKAACDLEMRLAAEPKKQQRVPYCYRADPELNPEDIEDGVGPEA